MARLLDYDPITGIRTTFDYDHQSDTTIIAYDDPFDRTGQILEWNKKRKASIDKNKLQSKRDLLHYARIPPMAQLDMYHKHKVAVWDTNDRKKMMKLLNTDEYADCRISHWKHDR